MQSPAFKDNQHIPVTYSGDGDYKSPPLAWSGVPAGTKELALIVDDPDIPMERFSVHWLLYNIPATTRSLPVEFKGATPGQNALKRLGYLPPKPFVGSGVHKYRFTIYALDADLPLKEGLTMPELVAAMKGHIIGQGTLVGLYERRAP